MLEDAGVSGIADVWMPPVVTGANIVVQVRKQYRGHAQPESAWPYGRPPARASGFFKNVTVVEEDIDIRDPEALEWAFAFRVNAGRGDVWLVGPTYGSVLDPSTLRADRDVKAYGTGKWTRTLIDATRSWEHPPNPDWDRQPLAAGQHHRSGPGTEDRRPLARLRHRRALSRRCNARATDARRNPQGAEGSVGANPSIRRSRHSDRSGKKAAEWMNLNTGT